MALHEWNLEGNSLQKLSCPVPQYLRKQQRFDHVLYL